MHRFALTIVFASLVWPPLAAAAQKAEPSFAAYPAVVYRGPVTQPAFRGAQGPYAAYRTRIGESVQAGVQFAGHYAVAVIGCGTGCRFGYITDVQTGLVYDLPHGGEEYVEITYRVRPDSRLLHTHWVRMSKDYDRIGCAFEDFIWTGKAFRSIGKRVSGDECRDEPDEAAAT